MKSASLVLVLLLIAPAGDRHLMRGETTSCTGTDHRLDAKGFEVVMGTVAEGWNRGDAQLSASCFAESADFFRTAFTATLRPEGFVCVVGGAKGRPLAMHMTWHHLLFDPTQQIGVGEYTFRYQKQTHGLVIVKIGDGLIVNWREYEIESRLAWDRFVGENRF